MLGSTTAPSRPGACDDAPVHVAFRSMHSVGVPGVLFFAAQYPAYAHPCQRFAVTLAGADA